MLADTGSGARPGAEEPAGTDFPADVATSRSTDVGSGAGHGREFLLLSAEQIYRWRGRVMGRTIFRTKVGALLLTTDRLLYLSSGGGGAWRKMAWIGLSAAPHPVGIGVTVTDAVKTLQGWVEQRWVAPASHEPMRIDPADLLRPGSLSVPLVDLTEYGVTTRRFSSFLWIAYRSADGQRHEFAFSNQIIIPGGDIWESTIRLARNARAGRLSQPPATG